MEDTKLMEIVQPLAEGIGSLDEQITNVACQLKMLKHERELLDAKLVTELQNQGIETAIGLPDGRMVKLHTDIYPRVLDVIQFHKWAGENGITLPEMQFNASTLKAWHREQMDGSMPVPPEDVVVTFTKTRIRINKGA